MLSNILQKIESIEKLEGLAQNGSSVGTKLGHIYYELNAEFCLINISHTMKCTLLIH